MIEFLKRQMTRTKRFYTYNKKTLSVGSIFAFFMFLSLYPAVVDISMADAYGNILTEESVLNCAGTMGDYNINGIDYINKSDCIVYVNLTTHNYSIKTPKALVYFDEPNTEYELQRADKRYRTDNPKRWKPYDLTSKWLPNESMTEFRLFIYKPINKTIKFGVKSGVSDFDPVLAGYDKDSFFTELTDLDVGFTTGYAEFTITNPLNKEIEINESNLKSLYVVVQGKVLSEEYSFFEHVPTKTIKVDKTTCIDNLVLKPVSVLNNETGLNETDVVGIIEQDCNTIKVDNIIPEMKEKKELGVVIPKNGNLTFRIDLTYRPNTIVNWNPQLEIDGVKFKQEKW